MKMNCLSKLFFKFQTKNWDEVSIKSHRKLSGNAGCESQWNCHIVKMNGDHATLVILWMDKLQTIVWNREISTQKYTTVQFNTFYKWVKLWNFIYRCELPKKADIYNFKMKFAICPFTALLVYTFAWKILWNRWRQFSLPLSTSFTTVWIWVTFDR